MGVRSFSGGARHSANPEAPSSSHRRGSRAAPPGHRFTTSERLQQRRQLLNKYYAPELPRFLGNANFQAELLSVLSSTTSIYISTWSKADPVYSDFG